MHKLEQTLRALKALETNRYCELTTMQICNNIAWLWKWRKITEAQMQSLSDRLCAYYDYQKALSMGDNETAVAYEIAMAEKWLVN